MLLACVSSARAESAVWRVDASTQCFYGTPDATPRSGSVPANWPVFAIALTGFVDVSQTRMTRMSDGHVVVANLDVGDGIGAGDFIEE